MNKINEEDAEKFNLEMEKELKNLKVKEDKNYPEEWKQIVIEMEELENKRNKEISPKKKPEIDDAFEHLKWSDELQRKIESRPGRGVVFSYPLLNELERKNPEDIKDFIKNYLQNIEKERKQMDDYIESCFELMTKMENQIMRDKKKTKSYLNETMTNIENTLKEFEKDDWEDETSEKLKKLNL